MTVGLKYSLQFPDTFWTDERIRDFFDEHPLAYEPECAFQEFFTVVVFGLTEDDITRCSMLFVDGAPCAMNLFLIVNPADEYERQLNETSMENVYKIVFDMFGLELEAEI